MQIIIKIVVLSFFIIPMIAYGKDESFLFSEDNDLQDDGDIGLLLKKQINNNIKNSEFLNTPLTRLDYVLINIEKKLEKKFNSDFLDLIVRNEFGSIDKQLPLPSIYTSVAYGEEIDKIIISVDLTVSAKPERSLKKICTEKVLLMMDIIFPTGSDWVYPNYLGVLNIKNINESLALKGNIIRIATLSSYHDEVFYTLRCYQDSEGVTRYSKYSERMSD
ncbi:hypothetical protein OAJ30_00045 [Alphaproteobacteria bacterium]|nr:hypothetical protein [Alphaproteobacteria bacterium]